MKKNLLFLLIVCSTLTLYSLQWPLPGAAPVSSFFQNSFLLEMQNEEQQKEVSPSMEGEILFIYTPDEWDTLALGDQSILVMEHQNQYRTLYSLDKLHEPVKQRQILSENDLIGTSPANPLGFGVWDLRSEGWVNPLLVLPGAGDPRGVSLNQIELRSDSGVLPLRADNTLESGEYNLFIQAEDLLDNPGEIPLLPYRIQCRYLGETIRDLEFSAAVYSQGFFRLMEGDLTVLSLVDAERGWLNLGEIQVGQGRADLEITIGDFAGNSKTTIFILRGKP